MMILTRRGQSILEYTIIVGIVTVVLYYMGTSIKRGVQSLVKLTADQVGNQENSDQNFNDQRQGYMVSSDSTTQELNNKQVSEIGYIPSSGVGVHFTDVSYNDYSDTFSNTVTNGGFTQTGS